MARLATFLWQTPAPTSVDEELALYDDGSVYLVVRRPLHGGPSVGTYKAAPGKGAFDELAATGPGPIQFDLLHTPAPAVLALMTRAREVADSALAGRAIGAHRARSTGVRRALQQRRAGGGVGGVAPTAAWLRDR